MKFTRSDNLNKSPPMWLRRRLLHQSQDQVQRSDRQSRSDQVDELPSCLDYLPLLEKGICLQDRTARLEVVADAIGAGGDPNAHCCCRINSVRLTDGRLGLPVVAVGGQLRVGTDRHRRVDSVDRRHHRAKAHQDSTAETEERQRAPGVRRHRRRRIPASTRRVTRGDTLKGGADRRLFALVRPRVRDCQDSGCVVFRNRYPVRTRMALAPTGRRVNCNDLFGNRRVVGGNGRPS